MLRVLLVGLVAALLSSCSSMRAVPANPQLAQIDVELMTLELQSQQTSMARVHLLEAIHVAPQDPEVMIAQGYFDEFLGDTHAATMAYQAGIAAAPHDPNVEDQYGSFLYRRGQYQQALSYFEEVAADPDNAASLEASENAALTAQKLHDPKLAKQYFAKVKVGG